MRAVNNYIIISEPVEEKKTSTGLLLTVDQSEEMRYGKGTVEEVGDKVTVVKKGDIDILRQETGAPGAAGGRAVRRDTRA
jgi:co-chaperonin GroES (HSP10)